jgi:DNA polymerase-3 subunit epsilon
LRKLRQLVLLKKTTTPEGFDTVALEVATDINAHELDEIMGMFKSKKQATNFLELMCEKYSLCKKILGIEHGSKSCFGYHLGTCNGACRGDEKAIKYNMRFLLAFAENRIKPWYFDKPIEIVETTRATGKTERFILDKWCILKHQTEEDTLDQNEYVFDVDTYKIIARYLNHYYFKKRYKDGVDVSIKTLQ